MLSGDEVYDDDITSGPPLDEAWNADIDVRPDDAWNAELDVRPSEDEL